MNIYKCAPETRCSRYFLCCNSVKLLVKKKPSDDDINSTLVPRHITWKIISRQCSHICKDFLSRQSFCETRKKNLFVDQNNLGNIFFARNARF